MQEIKIYIKRFLYSNIFNMKRMCLKYSYVEILYRHIFVLFNSDFLCIAETNKLNIFQGILIIFKKLKRQINSFIYMYLIGITDFNKIIVFSYNSQKITADNVIKMRCINIEKGGENEL